MNDINHIFTFEKKFDSRRTPKEYWSIRFRHNGKEFKTGRTLAHAEALAFNWVNNANNNKIMLEIVAELMLLD